MRKLIRLVVLLVVLLLVAGGVFWYYVDRIAKTGVERGATYALGVPTTLASADVGLLVGTVRLNDLTVTNPEGYETPHLLAVDRFDLGVATNTLMQETIQVNRFELDGVDLYVEQKLGTSNMARVLENIKARTGGGGEAPEEEKPGGKKIQVDRIVVRNITAHVQILPIGGKATTVDVEVPEIVLEDVTSDEGKGLAVAELTQRLLPAILSAVIKKGRGTIPDMDLDRLAANVNETTQALGEKARDLVEQTRKDVGGMLEKVLKGGKDSGEGEEGGGLLDGILKPKEGEEGDKKGGLLDGILKPKEGEKGDTKGGLLDGILKKQDER